MNKVLVCLKMTYKMIYPIWVHIYFVRLCIDLFAIILKNCSLSEDDEWTCGKCTLINRGDLQNCDACDTPKPRREPGLPNVFNQEPIGYYQAQPEKGNDVF